MSPLLGVAETEVSLAMELTTVVSRNHVMMRNGEIVQKGTFEY